jgi:hypothetical protein
MAWIGVDLDGTLAEHYWPDKGPYGHTHIGKPIPRMIDRVKGWVAASIDVRIFTARVGPADPGFDQAPARKAIEAWCIEHIGRVLPVTATKDYQMVELWDDRAVQIIPNTGMRADGIS